MGENTNLYMCEVSGDDHHWIRHEPGVLCVYCKMPYVAAAHVVEVQDKERDFLWKSVRLLVGMVDLMHKHGDIPVYIAREGSVHEEILETDLDFFKTEFGFFERQQLPDRIVM